MCLYMSVPLWINVERLTTAVSTTASQLFDVSLLIFLLNCKSSTVAATTAATTATAATTVPSSSATALKPARHGCKQLKQILQQTQIKTAATTAKALTELTAATATKSPHEPVDKIPHSSLPPHIVNIMLDDVGV